MLPTIGNTYNKSATIVAVQVESFRKKVRDTREVARQYNALVTRQSADRTLGRFHSPEIRGAVGALEDDGYISDDDTVAVHFEYKDGSDPGWELGVVEKMVVNKGKTAYPVHQLNRDDPNGEMHVRWYEPVMVSAKKGQPKQQKRVNGKLAFQLKIHARWGLNYKITTKELICTVDMQLDNASGYFLLNPVDEAACNDFMADPGAYSSAGEKTAKPKGGKYRKRLNPKSKCETV